MPSPSPTIGMMMRMTSLASLVFFSDDAAGLAGVLRALGIDLEHEVHDDQVEHWAAEVGDVHVAVYAGESIAEAPDLRAGGSTFPGVYVTGLETLVEDAVAAGASVVTGHEQRPWGCRMIVRAPGGHVIEVNERDHCRAAG